MPRDNTGVYSLPAGAIVNNGDQVLPSQHNPPLQDIASALTGSLSRTGIGAMQADLDHGGFKATNLAPGTNSSDAVTLGQLSTQGLPIGASVDFWGDTAPDGWFLCYGQAISRVDYAALFAILGTKYGSGDGASTFNLPDCRGRATAGRDDMGGTAAGRLTNPVDGTTLGAVGGAQSHALTLEQMPAHDHGAATGSNGAHSHTISFQQHFGFTPGGGGSGPYQSVTSGSAGTSSASSHTHSISSAGGGEAHPNVQPTIVANKIIRAF